MNSKDFLIILTLAFSDGERAWTYQSLAEVLGLSPSQVHASVGRLQLSGLLTGKGPQGRVDLEALGAFMVHGAPYVFPPVFGKVVCGIPTGASSPLFDPRLKNNEVDLPTVWPFAEGACRGTGLAPIHPCVPGAVLRDPGLHRALVHFDALRMGTSREREAAASYFSASLGKAPGPEPSHAKCPRPGPPVPSWKAW